MTMITDLQFDFLIITSTLDDLITDVLAAHNFLLKTSCPYSHTVTLGSDSRIVGFHTYPML